MQLLNDFHSIFLFCFYPIHYFQRPHAFLLRPVFYIIYIKTGETIVIHCDCSLVNLYVRLKTGGEPEK